MTRSNFLDQQLTEITQSRAFPRKRMVLRLAGAKNPTMFPIRTLFLNRVCWHRACSLRCSPNPAWKDGCKSSPAVFKEVHEVR
jgi:hypothetical protein